MKNEGRISIWGILFLILVLAVIFGKTSFWHIVFFPFYMSLGILGMILGIILLVVVICVIGLLLIKIFG